MLPPTFHIGHRSISQDEPTYIIAELSCNHLQDVNVAKELIRAAGRAGADAVKLQTYTADTMTIDCDKEVFKIKGTMWEGENLYSLYKRAYTPWEWTAELQELAHSLNMDLFTSPFDPSAVEFLEKNKVPCYKVASFEIVDHILLEAIGKTGKPVIMSTGMASLSEIEYAVNILRSHGTTELALLKCTSAYPAEPKDANLCCIPHLAQTFQVVAGLSDHTLGVEVPIVSLALGARIIEKHFTLSRESGSPDDAFSLVETEFKMMVESVRVAEATLGKISYGKISSESATRGLRRSLFVVEDMKAGDPFTERNVRSIRPGGGLHTKHFQEIMGMVARRDIARGTPLSWMHAEESVSK